MELILLYLFLKLDTIQTLFSLSAIVFACLSFGSYAFAIADKITGGTGSKGWASRSRMFSHSRKTVWVMVLFVLLVVAIPTTKQAAILMAGWGVLEVVKSEKVGKLASRSLVIIEKHLDEYLKGLEGK